MWMILLAQPHVVNQECEMTDSDLSVEIIFSDGKFRNAEEFSLFIEKQALKTGERYLDVLLEYCKDNDIEPETLAKSLTSSLKEKLQAECEQYNLLKHKSIRLPE